MAFRFFIITACLFTLCLLLITGTRLLARRDPPARIAALLPDPSCEPPCWQGLRPGYVEVEEVQNWIDGAPFGWKIHSHRLKVEVGGRIAWWVTMQDKNKFDRFRFLVDQSHNGPINSLILWPDDLVVGELMAVLGAPDYIDFNLGYDEYYQMMLTFDMYYQEPHLIASHTMLLDNAALYPNTPVGALIYDARPWSRPVLAFDWLGFGRITRYYPHGVLP